MKEILISDIEKATLENDNYRKVLFTGKQSQLVLMCLEEQEEIGLEVHKDSDQFFHFEHGEGKVIVDEKEHEVTRGIGIIVPAGSEHNIINTSSNDKLKFYTIYSPPQDKENLVIRNKNDEGDME